MGQIETVRVRHDWIQEELESRGGVTAFAVHLGMDKSTVSRQSTGDVEAGPRFIGAVLVHCGVAFEDAFDVTVEQTVRRTVRRQNRQPLPAARQVEQVPA